MQTEADIRRRPDGSIDIEYYLTLARNRRGHSVCDMARPARGARSKGGSDAAGRSPAAVLFWVFGKIFWSAWENQQGASKPN